MFFSFLKQRKQNSKNRFSDDDFVFFCLVNGLSQRRSTFHFVLLKLWYLAFGLDFYLFIIEYFRNCFGAISFAFWCRTNQKKLIDAACNRIDFSDWMLNVKCSMHHKHHRKVPTEMKCVRHTYSLIYIFCSVINRAFLIVKWRIRMQYYATQIVLVKVFRIKLNKKWDKSWMYIFQKCFGYTIAWVFLQQ